MGWNRDLWLRVEVPLGSLRNVVRERSRLGSLCKTWVFWKPVTWTCLVGAMVFASRNDAEHQDGIALALGRGAPQNS